MKKSTKNTNQIQKLIDQNRHYQRTSNWSIFALLCTRKFVPKIRTPQIRTSNLNQKFIPKIRTENLYMRTYHPCAKKIEISSKSRFQKTITKTIAKIKTSVMTGLLRIQPIYDFRDFPENCHSVDEYFRSKF